MAQSLALDVSTRPADRGLRAWLIVCCALIFAMVVVGGVTRLTGSGLSMVEWRPLIGALPPWGDAEWARVFALYQGSPQYQQVNAGMSLTAFKAIFWWEYIHRLLGRLIGVVFLLPFLWFAWRGAITRARAVRLAIIFVLGGAQGLLGWYMVQSGLVDRPEVSQYRLVAHLSLALTLYAVLVWTVMDLGAKPAQFSGRLAGPARLILAVVVLTIIAGGLVAGTRAGLTYNTFPLMDGRVVPRGYFALSPWYANPFENVTAIQFDHRVLGVLTVLGALGFWWRSRATRARAIGRWLAVAALAQAGLGIVTLVLVVPVPLAALHQAGAVAVLTVALWAVHATTNGDRINGDSI